MYPAKLHVDTLLGLCNNTNPLPRGMEESRKGFQLGIKWSRRTGTLAGTPVVRVRGKPLPRALGAAVLPTASWGSCRGVGGGAAEQAALGRQPLSLARSVLTSLAPREVS